MATPAPVTHSSLDTFVTCGKQFYHKYVVRDVVDVQGPAQLRGDEAHREFENYLNASGGYTLKGEWAQHKKKLDQLLQKPGIFWCEEKCAIDKTLQACRYDDPDRLWRGKIDFRVVDKDTGTATLVDFKTGKKRDKWEQLAWYALHTFYLFPNVHIINAQFYWTVDQTTTKRVWGRGDIESLWAYFVSDLQQYKQAWKTDTWQERPSGLCNGWCPVKTCQHWRPKRDR